MMTSSKHASLNKLLRNKPRSSQNVIQLWFTKRHSPSQANGEKENNKLPPTTLTRAEITLEIEPWPLRSTHDRKPMHDFT